MRSGSSPHRSSDGSPSAPKPPRGGKDKKPSKKEPSKKESKASKDSKGKKKGKKDREPSPESSSDGSESKKSSSVSGSSSLDLVDADAILDELADTVEDKEMIDDMRSEIEEAVARFSQPRGDDSDSGSRNGDDDEKYVITYI